MGKRKSTKQPPRTETTNDYQVDSFIINFKENNRSIDDPRVRGIEKFPAFCRVIAEYLRLGSDEAESKTRILVFRLCNLAFRVQLASSDIHDITWDREWNEIQKNWKEKKGKLAQALRDAADLFDTGQCDSVDHSLFNSQKAGAKISDWVLKRNGNSNMDVPIWCGSKHLRAWADVVDLTPVDSVFPIARPPGLYAPFSDIGTRGGAADPDSALRAIVCREIGNRVPETLRNRYSTIANLAEYIGMSVDPHYVRSLLKKGRT